ncbi:MAG TPA: penicillin-binding transpeptidase domain-containing protein, partial [Micromonosporaceae bacterium]|nr:penicillin-binding transpeptidase domain-containing protein [Micromonosporaceae bacterium]
MRQDRLPTRRAPRTKRILLAAGSAAALLAGGLTGCSGSDGPEKAVDAFLAGWRSGTFDQVAFLTPAGQQVPGTDVAAQIKQVSGELAGAPPQLRRDGAVEVDDELATARVAVDWTLPGGTHWTYPTSVRLKQDGDTWRVIWEPAVVQEKLSSGEQLAVRRLPAARGSILDGAGQPLVGPRSVVTIGVQPSKVPDVGALVRDLESALRAIRPALSPPVDLSDLPARMRAAKPTALVEVITLRQEAYLQIKPRIYDLPGTRFVTAKRQLAPGREFARALLGTVDPVQREDLEKNPGVYAEGDVIGHGGLQGRYESRLRGTVGSSVYVVRKTPDGKIEETGTELFRQEPAAGAPLKTTLDLGIQRAADGALQGDPHRTALVAVRVSDGAILAAANGPDGGTDNLAFTASVPPGSTFKMVSALGLLNAGAVSLDGPVLCKRTETVEGRPFKNSDNFELGTVPFRVAFAKSCNTAFVSLAPQLGADGLAEAGRAVGLEADWDLGTDAFTGKVSTGGSASERAAAAFGQGTTVVSPVAMAAATAAVARGQWQQPKLVLDPAPGKAAPAGPQLAATSVEPLRQMMREVVTAGTGAALRDIPGQPVYGKTGTAEYDGNPAHT